MSIDASREGNNSQVSLAHEKDTHGGGGSNTMFYRKLMEALDAKRQGSDIEKRVWGKSFIIQNKGVVHNNWTVESRGA
jgi:hypothetical protein